MDRRKQIRVLAQRFADRRWGFSTFIAPCMLKAYRREAIVKFADAWLTAHGELPQGVHEIGPTNAAGEPLMMIDFDRLKSDPDYPEGELAQLRREYREQKRAGKGSAA